MSPKQSSNSNRLQIGQEIANDFKNGDACDKNGDAYDENGDAYDENGDAYDENGDDYDEAADADDENFDEKYENNDDNDDDDFKVDDDVATGGLPPDFVIKRYQVPVDMYNFTFANPIFGLGCEKIIVAQEEGIAY